MTRTCVLWKRFVVLLPDDFEYSTSRFANPERTSNQVSAIGVSRQPNAAAKCSHTSSLHRRVNAGTGVLRVPSAARSGRQCRGEGASALVERTIRTRIERRG